MIVLDIETSGMDPSVNGIWQVGAFDFFDPDNSFLGECRVDDGDVVHPGALRVTGKTEEELRDKSKQSQRELLEKFFLWVESVGVKNVLCQNPHFDRGFLQTKAFKYGLFDSSDPFSFPIHYRTFDSHSFAQLKYFQVHGKFLIDEANQCSGMNLSSILKFCGLTGLTVPHDALGDAKLTGEVFSRLVYGKFLFAEFSSFEVPQYLKAS